MELRPNLKPTEWEDHQTSNILLIGSFLEVHGNPIPGFPGKIDILAWLENKQSFG